MQKLSFLVLALVPAFILIAVLTVLFQVVILITLSPDLAYAYSKMRPVLVPSLAGFFCLWSMVLFYESRKS